MASGYQGRDSQRENAEKMFRNTFPMAEGKGVHKLNKGQSDLHMPRLLSNPSDNMNMQSMADMKKAKAYANGGYADGGKAKKVHKKADGGSVPGGILGGGLGGYLGSKAGDWIGNKIGGSEGADLGRWLGSTAGSVLGGIGGGMLPFKKGGAAKEKSSAKAMLNTHTKQRGRMAKADGGSVYERDMLGKRTSKVRPHIDYEAQMCGTKPLKRAAGGVAKMRLGQATSEGKPVSKQIRNRGVC